MIEKTDFSIDIPVDPRAGFKPLPDLYAFDSCKAYPVTEGNLLLHNVRNGKRVMVRPEVYASLLRCDEFRTLERHADNIIAQNPSMQGQQADIRNVLQQMGNAGIMRSAKSLVEELKNSPADSSADERKPVSAIITWERPAALQRLLASIADNCDTARLHCLYVVDDSRSEENAEANRALVARYTEQMKAPLHYLGQAEQQSYIRKLAQVIPQHENAIRHLIDQGRWVDQWTCGLSRNVAVFLSCGRRLVVMDDDVICDLYDPPSPGSEIRFSDAARETDFFASKEDWSHFRQQINPDPIERHLRFLGLGLSEAIGALGQQHLKRSSLEGAPCSLANELHPASPVLVTALGSFGCPGTEDNTWLPNMAAGSLQKMLASQKKTSDALTRRQVFSGRNRPHFSPRPNMSQMTGLDNRRMLPPYLPITRGEDRLFGYMLDFVFPTAVTLDYPAAVPHLPIPEREWTMQDLDFTPRGRFPLFFFNKVMEQRDFCRSSGPADRTGALAAFFRDLAAASSETLQGMQRDASLAIGSRKLRRLDELLASGTSIPVDWQNYLRNGIRQLSTGLDAVSRSDLPVKGLPAELEGEALIAFWRETWDGFAEALAAWPEIREAAATLADSGEPPWA
ncbi:MAG: hypothetical protein PVF46_01795 [Lysobacterales bacterium]|jgi:hypothetical protein